VWWPGCKDETASEERLRASVSVITATVSKVEQCQFELMELLLATPYQQSSSSSSAADDGDCALLVFLRFLLQKNRSALRDVPPPGLSEPTVIMSTFFGLLRLLQPALRAAQEQGTGPLAAFPAAELLAGSGPSAEAEPVFDVPRLGGTIRHLAREHPTSDLDKQPVQVLQQQQYGSSSCTEPPVLKDAWVPELLNSCMLLYAWRVGFSYKMIHSLSSSVASSSATLDELDRMIAASSEAGDALQVGLLR
jgi:Kip1 ubiquitination-promoting complex protein 1